MTNFDPNDMQLYHVRLIIVMDELDDILFLEEKILKEGYEQGKKDAPKAGYEDGYEIGFLRGFEYSMEVSYYQQIAQYHLNLGNHSERTLKALENVITAAKNFPRWNDQEKDVLNCLQQVRNKFKLLRVVMKWDKFVFADDRKRILSTAGKQPNSNMSF